MKASVFVGVALCIAFTAAHAETVGPGHYRDSSGRKVSGECDNYSNWYSFCTRDIEPGRSIASFSYSLGGDRQCGAWAECSVTRDSPDRKCVSFRMQGHSENCRLPNMKPGSNNGTGESEMILEYDVQ